MRAIPCLLLCLALAGCALFPSPAERAMQRTPDYKSGYSDGCTSAQTAGDRMGETGLTRDDAAYQSNKTYRAGWGSGYGACRPQMTMPGGMNRPPGAGPIADPY